ncbi:hypothetical protein HOV17_gp03 [Halorubrum pleomorphic virus 9]|uniref:Uncharacterized protein n=1 Tax=Halorubrum pleomorphic virus 9 TaxID=2126525 RepID=A0A3S7I9G8_9VIRU|nr:hypothetical protein HOV17_gp03 [Halorubrum pleomorphic virus 9]AVP39967.1 hypothetical protein [Halorubrum pleomorphic virus 9]
MSDVSEYVDELTETERKDLEQTVLSRVQSSREHAERLVEGLTEEELREHLEEVER